MIGNRFFVVRPFQSLGWMYYAVNVFEEASVLDLKS